MLDKLCIKKLLEYFLSMIKWYQIKRSHHERLLSIILMSECYHGIKPWQLIYW
jgi:hypothetical protein